MTDFTTCAPSPHTHEVPVWGSIAENPARTGGWQPHLPGTAGALPRTMSTVVCGTDLSESSLPIARADANLAQLLDARLELFKVVTIPPFLGPDLLDEEEVTDLRLSSEGLLSRQAVQVRREGLML